MAIYKRVIMYRIETYLHISNVSRNFTIKAHSAYLPKTLYIYDMVMMMLTIYKKNKYLCVRYTLRVVACSTQQNTKRTQQWKHWIGTKQLKYVDGIPFDSHVVVDDDDNDDVVLNIYALPNTTRLSSVASSSFYSRMFIQMRALFASIFSSFHWNLTLFVALSSSSSSSAYSFDFIANLLWH